MIDDKAFWGGIAVVLSLAGLLPYLYGMFKGKLKPHLFTWLLWSLMTVIAAAAQILGGAGAGAWPTLITAVLCVVILIGSFFCGEKNITRSDWVMLGLGLLAIPLWLVTKDPTASIILVTFIDLSAFVPTFRKAWHKPWEESLNNCLTSLAKHACTLFALDQVNIVTALFPAAILLANVGISTMLIMRRRQLGAR